MTHHSLIVARMQPGNAGRVAELFAASDATRLPQSLGVVRRSLYSFGDLYFHHVEFAGPAGEALDRARQRPDFNKLSADLADFVTPYDPQTWRGPKDALAREFYSWVALAGADR